MVSALLSETDFTDDERRGVEKVREFGRQLLKHNNNVEHSDLKKCYVLGFAY